MILDDNGIKYARLTIIQTSHLKEKLKALKLKQNKVMIILIDAEAIYPSIKFRLVQKAVHHFMHHLEDQATINMCLELIHFGMSLTLLTFQDKYYEYGGGRDIEEKGLAIRGYELVFLANLAVAFLFKVCDREYEVFKEMHFKGIYHDNRLAVIEGQKLRSDINHWLGNFQSTINKIAGNDFLKFTACIWSYRRESPPQ